MMRLSRRSQFALSAVLFVTAVMLHGQWGVEVRAQRGEDARPSAAASASSRRSRAGSRPDLEHLNTTLEVSDIVAGVQAGGSGKGAPIDAVYETHLHRFRATYFFGDGKGRSPRFGLRIVPWPRRYFCVDNSAWGSNPWPDTVERFTKYDRCIQFKMFYVLTSLRELEPDALAYLVTETDVLVNPDPLIALIHQMQSPRWAIFARMGVPHAFSAEFLSDFTTRGPGWMRCTSFHMVDASKRRNGLDFQLFKRCYEKLRKACGHPAVKRTTTFQRCVDRLTLVDRFGGSGGRCPWRRARPEYGAPLLVAQTSWDHNQDNLVAGCLTESRWWTDRGMRTIPLQSGTSLPGLDVVGTAPSQPRHASTLWAQTRDFFDCTRGPSETPPGWFSGAPDLFVPGNRTRCGHARVIAYHHLEPDEMRRASMILGLPLAKIP